MEMTKKTIMVWEDEAAKKQPPELEIERLEWIKQRCAENKTNGISLQVSDTTVERYWIDQAAAEEWKTYLLAAVNKYKARLISIEIKDM